MSEYQSQEIGKLAEALAKAQVDIQGAKEDSSNPFFKSKYADLTSVWSACRVQLSTNGLAVMQTIETKEDKMILVTTLAHTSGQWVKSHLPIMAAKMDAQSVGSAITYARRYALSALVGVCPHDDDAEAAMKSAREEVIKAQMHDKKISVQEVAILESLLADVREQDYQEKLMKHLGIANLYDMKAVDYEKVMKSVNKKIQEKSNDKARTS